MAKVKELCLPKVQLLPQRAWGQSPYCSHYLHLTSTWKVGLLWLPTPDQLHPLPRQGPAPAPHGCAPQPLRPTPHGRKGSALRTQACTVRRGSAASYGSRINVPSSWRLRLTCNQPDQPFPNSQKA